MDIDFKWKWLLLILLLVALIYRLGYLPLAFEEPRRAEVALEMSINDNFIVPTINDTFYYNKPPFYNWLLSGVFMLFSTHEEWSVRIITVLSFLFMAGAAFVFAKKYINGRSAWLVLFFILTTGDILYRFSFLGEIDVFYALLIVVQALLIFHFGQKRNYWALFIGSYLLCAAGFLTKGLTSPAFQVFTLLGWGIGFKQFKRLISVPHFVGILIFFVTTGIYFFTYSFYNDPWVFILKLISESSQRTVTEGSFSGYLISWAKFPLMLLSVTLPWCLVFIMLSKNKLRELLKNDLIKFSLIFIISNIVIFWISPGTRPRYLYPLIPYIMLIAAGTMDRYFSYSRYSRYLEYLWGFLAILLTIGFMVAPFIGIPEGLEHPVLLFTAIALVFSLLTFFYFKAKRGRIWIFIAVLISLRLAFNLVVMPIRKYQDSQSIPYKETAREIVGIIGQEKVWLYSPQEKTILKPSLFGIPLPELSYEMISWPSFHISYYIASRTGNILSWNGSLEPDKYYFANVKHIDRDQDKLMIIKKFSIPAKNLEYVLFQYKQ